MPGSRKIERVMGIISRGWCCIVLVCSVLGGSLAGGQVATGWQIGPFQRLSDAPVIGPGNATFLDPITGKEVSWEKLHTFNPAAITRDGKVCVLYRAEDDTGR